MFRIAGIHHVALIVSDYSRSKRFYTEILGLPVVAETFRSERSSYKLDLRLGDGVQLELFSFPAPPARPTRPEACGLRHLAFRVADLDAAIGDLRSRDVHVEAIRLDELTGRRFAFFPDPDGLPLELYEITEPGVDP
jgi:glyoxylase I family protein